MRLINLSKKGDTYVVKALQFFRILGINLWSNTAEFRKEDSSANWYNADSKKVGPRTSKILDKWLKDHQRFIG